MPLILVRHGETDWNVEGRLQGRRDVPLNPRGRDQARAVGRLLAGAVPDLSKRPFFVSPLTRATDTARLLREAAGLDPDLFVTEERLAELGFGAWEGSTMREIREREPAEARRRDAARWTHRPPGGESYEDVESRLATFFAALDRPSVIVAHGGVIRAALALLGAGARETLPGLHVRQGRAILLNSEGWRWLSQ
ncbi:histidine phosphatase family protein [Hansschlegelia quercus]|uniref:Histidine phosphatase family protein n=1 Tax=Hansschlegelia quercus TaxID=2528245 RepID=A0A4Q9GLZ7_9HYPH|nr:histidine phosphatase family protein [Hansschlegelia quercus]